MDNYITKDIINSGYAPKLKQNIPITVHNPSFPNIINKSKQRIYKNAVLLTPGTWADSTSNMYNYYPKEVLKKYAGNVITNYIDINHDYRNVLYRIGEIKNQHWDEQKNAVVGDLYINLDTSIAKDIVALIDNNTINGLSVEIGTQDVWDFKLDMPRVEYIEFYGVSIVPTEFTACKDAKIK